MEDFYRVCVVVPLVFLEIPCRLYLLDEERNHLQLICASDRGLVEPPQPAAMELDCHPRTPG
ncbi:MAG: hypothetical protein U5J62_06485 [Desulfurivibrio sp.]|nr:hypothetical protein [Desulfurivibrio sp.]